ncbi:DgyrCDS12608 [Dimorphilus gyrociliatus]|uniref:DgyrCDS12608 n=1 Tax=Dimorphilus gyrociliatus TaxID=2664684 RepID=A0A7I8W870_9ANNE|nr:DgyrCDS12608 [Dimorphilus gyrociliatus]
MEAINDHKHLVNGESDSGSRMQSPTADRVSSFLKAARNGNLEKVIVYLDSGIDVDISNNTGLNALHLASKEGYSAVVEELLNRKANLDAPTRKGNTPLHIASLAGKHNIVETLLRNGAKVNVQSQNGFTPLYMAAQENHAAVVALLLQNGASPTLTTDNGFTPLSIALQQGHKKVVEELIQTDRSRKVKLPSLHLAAKNNNTSAVQLFLNSPDADPNLASKGGFTALHIASHYGSEDVGRMLIERGANLDYRAKNNICPLHVASKWNRAGMVKLLLDNGADISSSTKDLLTALHCSSRSGHSSVVELLLEFNAPVDARTRNKLTPLHMAAQGNHYDTGRLLIFKGAPIEEVTIDYLTPLHVASHCGSYEMAKLLLDSRCVVDARARNGFTPLHIACKKNKPRIIELLLKYGSMIDSTTETGLTPLHVASWSGHNQIVSYLIEQRANPNQKTNRGETCLHMAVRGKQLETTKLLIKSGAQVNATANENETALHIAAKLGDPEMTECLLYHGADVNAVTNGNYTALHIASREGNDRVVEVLLNNKAAINSFTSQKFTALHLAAKKGHTDVAKILLKKGAKVDAVGKNNLTPLHVAAHYNKIDVAVLLLERGASPNSQAKNGMTPLHIAAKRNELALANILINYKANTNAKTKNGFTPLHEASQHGHRDMAALLLEKGADVNFASNNGLRPMHLCAQEDHVPVAEVLVKYHAQIDPQTKAGYTPLHTACHFGQINMIKFLLDQKANIHSTTKIGYTPLHQAAQQGHVLVINYLLKYRANPDSVSQTGHTPLSIAQKLGYISVIEALKRQTSVVANPDDHYYKHYQPEEMAEDGEMSDSDGDEDAFDTGVKPHEMSYMYGTMSPIRGGTLSERSHPSSFYHDDSIYSHTEHDEVFPQEDHMVSDFQQMDYAAMSESRLMSNSYSRMSFNSSFDPDNVVTKPPNVSGFLISFVVDAVGGAMTGCRHSGIRIIIPPGRACSPIKIICKLIKKEKLNFPPPLMENEGLASRILEMSPSGYQFAGDVIIEIPHFASLRQGEREIVILRSDDGETWKEHGVDTTAEVMEKIIEGSFDELEAAEKIYQKRISRIVTTNFPKYFALVSRIKQDSKLVGAEGAVLKSHSIPQVQVAFPAGALNKPTKLKLQVYEAPDDLVNKIFGHGQFASSPIVTIEPRRRKFHQYLTVTLPLPKGQRDPSPSLRLLCSIAGDIQPTQWEDITDSQPLQFSPNSVSFESKVSARFWLVDCRNRDAVLGKASELYKQTLSVPYMANFVIFAKPMEDNVGRVRVFCVTDDKMEKTLETQENFKEVAKSRDVEVVEGRTYLEFHGNLNPVMKSGDQLGLTFSPFRENRLPFAVCLKDRNQPASSCLTFMSKSRAAARREALKPVCTLTFELPGGVSKQVPEISIDAAQDGLDEIEPSELKLTSIADLLSEDWESLARELSADDKVETIKADYQFPSERALVFLHLWFNGSESDPKIEDLRQALINIERKDIVDSHFPTTTVQRRVESLNSVQEEEISHAGDSAVTEAAVFDPEIEKKKEEARDILASFMTDVELDLGNEAFSGEEIVSEAKQKADHASPFDVRDDSQNITDEGVEYDNEEEMDHATVVLRRDVTKQVRDGETIVQEDVNVIQESELPDECSQQIENVITEFTKKRDTN